MAATTLAPEAPLIHVVDYDVSSSVASAGVLRAACFDFRI
jgi:hypothetical protein